MKITLEIPWVFLTGRHERIRRRNGNIFVLTDRRLTAICWVETILNSLYSEGVFGARLEGQMLLATFTSWQSSAILSDSIFFLPWAYRKILFLGAVFASRLVFFIKFLNYLIFFWNTFSSLSRQYSSEMEKPNKFLFRPNSSSKFFTFNLQIANFFACMRFFIYKFKHGRVYVVNYNLWIS